MPRPKHSRTEQVRAATRLAPAGDSLELTDLDVIGIPAWPGPSEIPAAPEAVAPTYDNDPAAVDARMRHDAEHHTDPKVREALGALLDDPNVVPPGAVEEISDGFFRSPDVGTTLGQIVASYRKEFGLTQEQLARQLGVHQTQVVRLERGDHTPTVETLVRVARSLDVNLALRIVAGQPTLTVLARRTRGRSVRFGTGRSVAER